jgi:hypothetical protein
MLVDGCYSLLGMCRKMPGCRLSYRPWWPAADPLKNCSVFRRPNDGVDGCCAFFPVQAEKFCVSALKCPIHLASDEITCPLQKWLTAPATGIRQRPCCSYTQFSYNQLVFIVIQAFLDFPRIFSEQLPFPDIVFLLRSSIFAVL